MQHAHSLHKGQHAYIIVLVGLTRMHRTGCSEERHLSATHLAHRELESLSFTIIIMLAS